MAAASRARSSSSARGRRHWRAARDHIAEQIRLLEGRRRRFPRSSKHFSTCRDEGGARMRGGGRAARRRHDELPPARSRVQRRPHAGASARGRWPTAAPSPSARTASRTRADAAAAARNARRRSRFRSPRSRPPSAPRTSATASRACPRFPTIWKRSRCRAPRVRRVRRRPRGTRASATSAAAAAATPPTSVRSQRGWLPRGRPSRRMDVSIHRDPEDASAAAADCLATWLENPAVRTVMVAGGGVAPRSLPPHRGARARPPPPLDLHPR